MSSRRLRSRRALRGDIARAVAIAVAVAASGIAPAFAEADGVPGAAGGTGAAAGAVPPCPAPESVAQRATNDVRVVTGAPYSALGTTEIVTTLPDGNRIVRQNRVRLWRDSDGRTRSEYSLSSIGGPLPVEVNSTVTVIDDPSTGTRTLLQSNATQAVTVPIRPCRAGGSPAGERAPPPPNVTRPTNLGERELDGEKVSGSRIESTIPAGAIGNEQPIKMSAEQWYGQDLQVVVEATYSDPRTGETRYKLRDIKRQEPDARLFRVPPEPSKDEPKRKSAPVGDGEITGGGFNRR
ncbi:MAG TPA: hypothetical protein VMF52_11900 [Steroidobacteraceae bacterium]|nr:hypothetical protein [Steroidobacteraceae bacterium]